MSQTEPALRPPAEPHLRAALPFVATATLALLAGGILAAAFAHAPTRHMMWTVAFLVLIVGMAQLVLGAGQTLLGTRAPRTRTLALEWLLFNGGSAAVIAGTVCSRFPLLAGGSVAFLAALMLFQVAVRGSAYRWALLTYRLVLVLVATGALIGLTLGWLRAPT